MRSCRWCARTSVRAAESDVRLFVIAWKELLQLRRDRLTLAMMAVIPLLQLVLFGYAINTDVRHIPTIVADRDRSAQSRAFVRSLAATGYYDVVGHAESFDAVRRALRAGRAKVAVVVPAGYARDVLRGRSARVQLIVDGADPQTVASATNTATAMATAQSIRVLVDRVRARGGVASGAPVEVEANTWYNPDLRTAVYIVPGLTGVILTMTMVMLTAMAIARERERGTLEQLIVSPVRRVELVIGKIVPYVLIGYVQMTIILLAGHSIFAVPLVGSVGLLFAVAFVFIAANLALGLFFSTLAATQQQAMQMSFFFLLPNILLSGFMFPFEGMPRPAQWLAQGLPLTHFLRIVRGIVLKGAGWSEIAGELAWLAGLLGALVTLGALRFSKRLD
ncbi:MAG: ABC transporter permease [Deltaproteobacteria bacterium]|nr:MAG: ABC transporter permease [Deltaproteobacteria bacterium]